MAGRALGPCRSCPRSAGAAQRYWYWNRHGNSSNGGFSADVSSKRLRRAAAPAARARDVASCVSFWLIRIVDGATGLTTASDGTMTDRTHVIVDVIAGEVQP